MVDARESLLAQARQTLELARAAGADDAIVGVGQSQSTSYQFRDGKLEKLQHNTSWGLGVSLYVAGRYSGHSTNDPDPQRLARFLADAVALTRLLEPDPYRLIPDPALYRDRPELDLDQVDPSLANLERENILATLAEMDRLCHGQSKVISATSRFSHGFRQSARVTSNGFSGASQSTSVSWGSHVTLDEGSGKRPEAGHYAGHCHQRDIPQPLPVAQEALDRARRRLGSDKAASARAIMVVDAEAAPRIIGFLLGALSAASIHNKTSYLAQRLGQKIASELLTIDDNPLIPRSGASHLYDGEGISAKPMAVVAAGVLRNYYIDTYYGRKLGWQPTSGSMSNLRLALGEKNCTQLMADAGAGFYVNDWLGGNCDPTTGDFSLGVRGHVIRNGQAAEPVSEMNITGNMLELLANLAAVGNDPIPWYSSRCPSLLFRDVQFSGK